MLTLAAHLYIWRTFLREKQFVTRKFSIVELHVKRESYYNNSLDFLLLHFVTGPPYKGQGKLQVQVCQVFYFSFFNVRLFTKTKFNLSMNYFC